MPKPSELNRGVLSGAVATSSGVAVGISGTGRITMLGETCIDLTTCPLLVRVTGETRSGRAPRNVAGPHWSWSRVSRLRLELLVVATTVSVLLGISRAEDAVAVGLDESEVGEIGVGYDDSFSKDEAYAIAAATFRFQMEHWKNGRKDLTPGGFYLSLFGQDPPAAFMKRFQKEERVEGSASDFTTGKGAVMLKIRGLQRAPKGVVLVDSEFFQGALMALGFRYALGLRDGVWRVLRYAPTWKS